jgi:Zn-dependent protease with chaperone function
MPIDPARQEKAKEYARLRHRLFALELALSGLALILVLFTGISAGLRGLVHSVSQDPWISTALYFLAGIAGYGALFSPLTYYSGFLLPHRYGLATQNLRGWLWDLVKGTGLGILFGVIVIEVIYLVLRAAPEWWWLLAAGFLLLFNVVLANLAPVLIFPIFYKFKPLEDQELVSRLVNLAERAHTRVRGVYTMMLSEKTTAANAAFMGLGNTKRIVLGDTLYRDYSQDEIESVLAHELGHQVHNDIMWGIAFEGALTVAGLLVSDLVLRTGVTLFRFDGIADLAAMPLFALALGAFGLVTMPLGNGLSRWRESRADEYALESTRNPRAFVAAMEKLANQNLAELEPEAWVEILLYDHPPIGKRLKMGREAAA